MQAVYEIMPNTAGYWIGLSDEKVEGTFVWNDGTVLEDSSFSEWRPGEPNDYAAREDCVQIFKNMGWNDMPCNWVLSYICEYSGA